MKIRQGFVSNSSSSSFVCDVCGQECSGMDMELTWARMIECVNDHTVCYKHLDVQLSDLVFTRQEAIEYIKSLPYPECRKEIIAEIEQMSDDEFNEEFDELKDEINEEMFDDGYGYPSTHCPICQLKNVTNDMALDYICKKTNVTIQKVKEDIKAQFKNVDELNKYLKD